MTPTEKVLAALTDHGCEPRQNGHGWSAKCPVHDDRRPSLSIGDGDDGRALVNCHAGCSVDAICEALDLRVSDLMPPPGKLPTHKSKLHGKAKTNSNRRIVAQYDYRDEAGNVLFQAVRYEPKDFRQRQPKPGGGWDWSVRGLRVVPYRLPEILAEPTRPVVIVEGEKDADNLARFGVLATCNAGGAGKWTDEHSSILRGRRVIVLPDNDEAGRNHAQQVAQLLQGIAADRRIARRAGQGGRKRLDFNRRDKRGIEAAGRSRVGLDASGATVAGNRIVRRAGPARISDARIARRAAAIRGSRIAVAVLS
jgi:putative DNA primase/helicase